MMENQLLEIANALPSQLDFYHLGQMELRPVEFNEAETSAVAFRLFGDRSAIVIVLFEKSLDSSVYTEFGNLLASQIATRLNKENNLDIHISPPFTFNGTRINQLIQGVTPIQKTYVHLYKNSVIPIQTLILPSVVEEVGYA